jgi:AraC-like DNA-binding protein
MRIVSELAAGPRLYRPGPALAEHIEFFGHWIHRGGTYRSRALPRGAVTVVLDVGQRQRLDFYAADGDRKLSVPPAFVTGAQCASYVSDIVADEPVMAIHFRPGGALPFLGMSLADLDGGPVGIDEIWGRQGRELHERLIAARTVAARFALLGEFLLSRARLPAHRHSGVAAAMAAVEANPSIRMAEARRLAGLSTKRLVALFRDEVGLSPKEYARVRRFQAALRQLGRGAAGGAHIAAEVGYFDQSHFVREFRSFTGMTPTQYRQRRILLPSHVPVQRHKYPRPPAAASA